MRLRFYARPRSTRPTQRLIDAPRRLLIAAVAFVSAAPVAAMAAPAAPPTPTPPRARVIARLAERPQSEKCVGRRFIWVVVRYRVERVTRQKAPLALRANDLIHVRQACPARARGFSGLARGNAGVLRPGERHRLILEADASPFTHPRLVDPFQNEDAPTPRYRAVRTDRAERQAIIVLTLRGAGVSRKIRAEGPTLSVGSSLDADVLLRGAIQGEHLRFEVRGDVLWILPRGNATISVDGDKVELKGAPLTYKSRIRFGPYSAQVSLLTPRFLRESARKR